MTTYSFGVITDGKDPAILAKTIDGIVHQKNLGMPINEILIGGNVPAFNQFTGLIQTVSRPNLAKEGKLGAMRNALGRKMTGDILVFLDDDMRLHDDFYPGLETFLKQMEWFDVCSCRILNPDGTRYWDWAVWRPGTQRLLDYGEEDHKNIYITGGLCIIRRVVFEAVQWDEDRGFYEQEDIDFSERLKEQGFLIEFNPHSTVTHMADYTQIGNKVVKIEKSPEYPAPKSSGEKLRILWYSPLPWVASGYGIQSHQYIKFLQAEGHEVRLVPSGDVTGAPNIEWEGIKIQATGHEKGGLDAVVAYTEAWKPDLVVSLFDIWPRPEDIGLQIRMAGGRWCPIVPIDHFPLSPAIKDRLAFAHLPIAMSQFGVRIMEEAGLECGYVPHAFHGEAFHPEVEPAITDDRFIVGMVAANVGTYDRKGFQQAIEAFGMLGNDDYYFYIHTDPVQRGKHCVQIDALAKYMNVDLHYPEPWQLYQGLSSRAMASIIKSFDVLIMPSRGEGFGIPAIEAQAVGTPVVATNFTALRELTDQKFQLRPDRWVWTPLGSWQAVISSEDLADQIKYMRNIKKSYPAIWEDYQGEACKRVENYELDFVGHNYLLPTLYTAIATKEPSLS